ncbi:hypothetical protein [Azospirillum argentinense]
MNSLTAERRKRLRAVMTDSKRWGERLTVSCASSDGFAHKFRKREHASSH